MSFLKLFNSAGLCSYISKRLTNGLCLNTIFEKFICCTTFV